MSEVGGGGGRRRPLDEEFTLQVYPGCISPEVIYCPVPARRHTTAADIIDALITALRLDRGKCYVLAEVKEFGGEEWILNPSDCPVQRMMLWPRLALEARGSGEDYRFLLREKNLDGSIHYGSLQSWLRVTEERRRMVERGFLPQQQGPECEDLCGLPDLSERALLETLRTRFRQEKIYTYVGTILVAVNPFRFLPIYNPKYVKMYDNQRLGEREPHIYAVADAAYHAMLRRQHNQCIVISGETGSGKTQSTNFLIHHLTALSQKGYASGVEQIILGAGPVLEAFGNAKTSQNNNSSRFGKFIQVNYHETGTVRGAYVEKYLLEKSRLVYQEQQERNYHVFYYLLAGASAEEKTAFHLEGPENYHYLNQKMRLPHRQSWGDYDDEQDSLGGEGEDLRHDFERLQLAMEMVGFLTATRRQIVSLLSAILHLGNIQYKRKTYRDESIDISNPETLNIVSVLLEVQEEMLLDALITRKTVTVGEKLILPYRLPEAVTVRDSLAKSLYSALFDWIVFRINHALLNINSKAMDETSQTLSIGVLDIFGFEDYGSNSFEQFCINFANERLQHYFNQHLFQLEQEQYRSEGISWNNITYSDNSGCISLISKRPTGLIQLLDEESNFPQATHQTLLEKFKRHHDGNAYIEFPAVMEPAFIIHHYAGKVKYGVKDFREKNTDHMRPDIVALLRSSRNAFIRGMIAVSPVAAFRWALLRAFFRALWAFKQSGRNSGGRKAGSGPPCTTGSPGSAHKGLSSFSFLQHPVHQRSLQILQRCQTDQYNIPRRTPRTPLSDLQGANTIQERSPRELSWGTRRQSRLSSSPSYMEGGGIFISPPSSNLNSSNDSKLLERAHGILMRHKNIKSKPALPKHLLDVKSLKHLSNLTLHDRITKSLLHLHKKKKPPSISAQFQASLNKLMETLGQAEPYFVKCIRSNAEKVPLRFNDSLVLRQLRYTGMLETVRIRQSGYSCKYPFQDFMKQFSVLLPRDVAPIRKNIQEFFWRLVHSPDQYQVGRTMVFMKEQERQCLRDMLHHTVLQRIILLQRWMRAWLQRKRFLHLREAAITIQRCWRHYKRRWSEEECGAEADAIFQAVITIQFWWKSCKVQQRFLQMKASACVIQKFWREYCLRKHIAAVCIQAVWRGYFQRDLYQKQRKHIIALQAASRGYLARRRFHALQQKKANCTVEDHIPADRINRDSLPSPETDCSQWDDASIGHTVEQEHPLPSCSADINSSGEMPAEVHIRERPKSLENPIQKRVFRAKRESRRMRELEQAQFSLELLKVRSGGVSPSEERRWSAEIILDRVPDTPESEGSLGSLELISCEENPLPFEEPPEAPALHHSSPAHRLISTVNEASQGHSFSDPPTSMTCGQMDTTSGFYNTPVEEPLTSTINKSPSTSNHNAVNTDNELPCSPTYTLISSPSHSAVYGPSVSQPKGPVCSPSHVPLNSHSNGVHSSLSPGSPRSLNTSSNGPKSSSIQTLDSSTFSQEPPSAQDCVSPHIAFSSLLDDSNSHLPPSPASSAVDISWGASSSWRQKSPVLELSESAPAKTSLPIFYRSHPREPLMSSSLPTFFVPHQEALMEQDHSETGEFPADSVLQRLQKLNEEKEELQKQMQQQKERQMMEQIRREKQELERQRKMLDQQEHSEDSQHLAMRSSKKLSDRPQSLLLQSPQWRGPPKSTVEIKGLSVGGKSGPVSQIDRPTSMFLEQRRGQDRPGDDPVGEISAKGKRPWLHNTKNSSIFFTPKGNVSSDSDNSSSHPQQSARSDPAKRLDATESSGASEAPHRRKARMARTRSDFMTRGALGGGESEEDSDEQGESNPPIDPTEPAGRLVQACHSDSEMMMQRLHGTDRPNKLHKAVSQGEMSRVLIAPRPSEPDSRLQRGKIRFWGKMKTAEKLSTQSETFEMDTELSGRDSTATNYNDVDSGVWLVPRSPDLSRGREKENKDPSPKVQRRRSVKISSTALEPAQWQDERAQIICSASDLKCMDEFLQKKIGDLDSEDGKKDSMVDVLFKRALKEFRQNIFSLYSTSLMGEDGKSIRYRDLGALFEQIMDKTMRQQQPRSWSESPVRVWINTFKVFLDEFVTEYKPLNYASGKIQKTERKKRRKKESDIVEEHNGHVFKATQYNIPTYCEYCSSLIWIMDRAAVCKLCRFACHKKCCSQLTTACTKKYDLELSSRHFGVELSRLTNEDRTVPVLLEKLISYIEMHGLYTEGIYRKPGSTNKIRELRQILDTDIDNVNLDEYNIHVIASVFKQWLRELPNPLMTFELYEEFLRSMGLGERKETVRGVYSVIDQLSRTHLSTLERLIFHLVRIAQQEETNRMSANALAIVFAPCILRCPDTTDPLQSVQDIGKTTACVELIVMEQMNKYRARLKDINSLEFAENKAKSRLSLIRRSMKPVLIAVRFMSISRSSLPGKGRLRSGLSPVISGRTPVATDATSDHMLSTIPSEEETTDQQEVAMQQEERVLAQQIETLQKEKEELAYEMLALEPRASDDETLESEASLGTADSSENLNCESEGAASSRIERSSILGSARGPRTSEQTRTRRQVKRESESMDSGDRNLSSPTASSCLPHLGRKRFHLHPKSPFYRAMGESREPAPVNPLDPGAPPHFTSRGTFNPEKGRQKLKNIKQSPQKPREPAEGGEQRILRTDGSSQSLVLFGSNEFMV
ncbi:unconventional myosin-IXa isoform 2-T2 [Discoglossus pictus]